VIALARGFGVKSAPQPGQIRRDQPLGGYCGGADLEECRRMFGANLARICATCPD